jgi:UDP-N-acetylmuramate dehydrogenase
MRSASNFSPDRDVSLRCANTFGLEARAAYLATARAEEDAGAAVAFARDKGLPLLVLGGGSNLVLTRDFPGLVLAMRLAGKQLLRTEPDAWVVEAAAGENWHELVGWTVRHGYPGLENLALIPGTVGAAPIQNIGAYGVELAERLLAVRIFDPESGAIETLSGADCGFGYRDSVFKRSRRGAIVLSVQFRLPRPWQPVTRYGDVTAELAARGVTEPQPQDIFDAVVAVRTRKLPDPAQVGNVGSFFKNPVVTADRHAALRAQEPELVSYPQADGSFKLAAAWLIDRCGFKGKALGRVGVHARQALVLINLGGAAGQEVLDAAEAIRAAVRQRFGVELEAEPVVV